MIRFFPQIRGVCRSLALVLVVSAANGLAGTRADKPRIVVMHSYHVGFTWSENITRGIRETFHKHDSDIELCFEHMDTRRVNTGHYLTHLDSLYRCKYADRPVDAVIACDDNAFTFMIERGEHIFPAAPVVFCSVSGYEDSMRTGRNITGLRESIDIRATLEIALKLHPRTRAVQVITDMTPTGLALEKKARAVFEAFTGNLSFHYLDSLAADELDSTIAGLDEGTIVFLFIFSRDRKGRVFSHEQNLQRLAPICKVPIYAVWEFYMGHGIVGGKLTNGYEEGVHSSRLALRILNGEKADSIPIESSPTHYVFDYRKLRQFGVNENLLPEGSRVRYRPFSFYQAYRGRIAGAAALFALLVAMILVLVANIIRRRKAEEEVRQSGEKLSQALRGADLGMWELDFHTGEMNIDTRTMLLLGYEPGELAPTSEEWEKLIHPDDRSIVRIAMEAHLRGDTETFESEHRLKTRTGSWKWMLVRGRLMERDTAGTPLRVTGTHLDITEKKRIEEEKRAMQVQMQHAQKLESLGVLAGGIAHDFNNILTGILGNATLLQADIDAGSAQREHIDQITFAAQRAAGLCRQLLAYSGKGSTTIEPIDISQLISGIANLLAASVIRKTRVHYNLAHPVPLIEGDATQIQQVVMNLITNAAEAIADLSGEVTITTGVVEADRAYLRDAVHTDDLEPGSYVYVEVEDTGCGMDTQTMQQIFDPFFTTKFTGRGLGLSAVHGIMRNHNGALKIRSTPGRGTTIRILFPVTEHTGQHAGSTAVDSHEGAEKEWKGSGTLLVVDDDATARITAVRLLKHFGIQTIEAQDGKEAIDIFRTRRGDITCILLDLTMPRMDGETCLYHIREIDPHAKVIISSGYSEQDVIKRFQGKQNMAFMKKPYEIKELQRIIRAMLKP